MEYPVDETGLFLDWFLRLQSANLKTFICPDIMYNTFNSQSTISLLSRSTWQSLATIHSFQSVVLDHSPKIAHSFNCDEVNITCNAISKQMASVLIPWCCLTEASHMLHQFHTLSQQLNFYYQV